ncbi:DNA-directed DNA polymerase [Malassezia yamatoensis]|uniref:DNA polymerase epsilon subunit n=1 Tax=Malassezia yamatoensis TaxID=253288 RepID=A0AAJ5YVT9_9BASI|nr:DNA-directed DNA polymerase [Malassezia yamatoensis]
MDQARHSPVPADVRKIILRSFTKKHHLQLRSDAVQFVYETVKSHGMLEDMNMVTEAVDALAQALVDQHASGAQALQIDSFVVTSEILQKTYDRLVVESAESQGMPTHLQSTSVIHGDAPDRERFFHVVDAFRMPRLRFSGLRKVFQADERTASYFSSANASNEEMRERYDLLRSIVLRNEHFLPPLAIASGKDRESYMKLTTTKNLLGRVGQSCLLFGRLSTLPDGSYALEDGEGTVPVDLAHAVSDSDLMKIAGEGIFTEGANILVEGEYMADERLRAYAIGHPPSENREEARIHFGHIDFTGTGAVPTKHVAALRAQEMQHADACVAVFSEVHLDHAACMSNLRAIFQGYQDADFLPYVIVMCGNFSSLPIEADSERLDRYKAGFNDLADIMAGFPRLLRETHWVFVPGPDDPATTPVLPRARIPAPLIAGFQQKLPGEFCRSRLHWASNPCRILYYSQEIVVFRDDIMSKMLRSAVKLKHELHEGDLQKYVRGS